mgnify:CR=1 FL=1
MRRLATLLTLALALSCTRAADAQSKGAAAESLFEEGRKAMDAKDYDAACARFRESNRIDPAPGTVLNLARCEEARGKLATAWELYRRARDEFPAGDDRRDVANRFADALSARLPKLTLRLRADAPKGTIVRVGEIELGAGSLGVPVPMDPGKRELRIEAPGRRSRTLTIELAEKESRELEVGPGEPTAAGESVAADTAPQGSSRATWGWVIGGVGLAGLVAGSVTGFMVLDKKKTVDANCDSNKLCTPAGTDAADSGKALAPWTTAGLLAGVAGVGLGAYLILSSDTASGRQAVLRASPVAGGAQLNWSRTW